MAEDPDISSEKMHRWQISIWKDAQHCMLSGNCKLEQQWATTYKSIRIPKTKNPDNSKC